MSYDENWIVECIHALKGHVMNFQPANIFKKTGCMVFFGGAPQIKNYLFEPDVFKTD